MKNNFLFILILFFSLPLQAELFDLEYCIQKGIENNPTIKKHKYIIEEYYYKIKSVQSSFMPEISLFGEYSHSHDDTDPQIKI